MTAARAFVRYSTNSQPQSIGAIAMIEEFRNIWSAAAIVTRNSVSMGTASTNQKPMRRDLDQRGYEVGAHANVVSPNNSDTVSPVARRPLGDSPDRRACIAQRMAAKLELALKGSNLSTGCSASRSIPRFDVMLAALWISRKGWTFVRVAMVPSGASGSGLFALAMVAILDKITAEIGCPKKPLADCGCDCTVEFEAGLRFC